MTRKKAPSKEHRQLSYAFRGAARPLTKGEMQEMLRQAVENTPPAEPEKEDE